MPLEPSSGPAPWDDVSRLCALDSTAPAERALFVEFGFDPDERPEPRLDRDVLWEIARIEATRLGWTVPTDPVAHETRYTICFEVRPERPWNADEYARWKAADPAEQEAIGLAVRDRRQRRAIRLDVRSGGVVTHW